VAPREDGTHRVLYVDPDDDARERTVAALDERPLSVVGVDTVDRARSVANEERIDCVVSERYLADADALDLHATLEGPSFVLYTDDGDERLADAAMAAGVDGYVTKTQGVDRLRDRVVATVDDDPSDGSSAVDASPFAVVEWDRDGRIVGWNRRATDLFGYDRETAIGAAGDELLFDGSREHTGLADALDGETIRLVERNVCADGDPVTCEWHTTARVEGGAVVGAVSYVRAVGDGARRIEELEALNRTTRRLLRADSPEAVGKATLEAVEGVLHQPVAAVRLYDDDSETLELVAATDEAWALHGEFPPVGSDDGLIWDAYESGVRQTFEDVPVEDTVHGQPLPIEDGVIQPLGEYGVISFGHTAPGTVDATDLHLARVLATTAEAALDRTEVREQLRRRKEKIEGLHDVVRDLETCETAADVWKLAVEAAERILEFDECGVDEVVEDHLIVRATSSELLPEGYVERTPITDGIAGKTYRTGDTYLVDDVTADNDATPESETYRSLLSVPIGDHGVFQAVSEEIGSFDDDDAELAELLLAHVGNALERLDAETELREQRDRFAALFENVPDPVVFSVHPEGRPIVESVNTAFEETFGFTEATIRGTDLDEHVVPTGHRDEGREIDHVVAEEGVVLEREVTRQTADGLREFLLTVVPVDLGERSNYTFGIYTDITERKQRRQRVEVLNRVLRHDLRNGMNIIKGAAETLTGSVDEEQRLDLANSVTDRANELLETAEKTRTVERTLDRKRAPLEPTDAAAVIRHACDAIRTEYPEAALDLDVPERTLVTADDMLETALYHVLENACLHNDRDPEIRVWVETEGDSVAVKVADNGPGIPDEERALVAEDREITQLNHASGLGLWLVNWVVTRAGGSLSFTENDPRGTVVTLQLPTSTEQIQQ